jgi:hypothetical protein
MEKYQVKVNLPTKVVLSSGELATIEECSAFINNLKIEIVKVSDTYESV